MSESELQAAEETLWSTKTKSSKATKSLLRFFNGALNHYTQHVSGIKLMFILNNTWSVLFYSYCTDIDIDHLDFLGRADTYKSVRMEGLVNNRRNFTVDSMFLFPATAGLYFFIFGLFADVVLPSRRYVYFVFVFPLSSKPQSLYTIYIWDKTHVCTKWYMIISAVL